jgi:hypothetical protein
MSLSAQQRRTILALMTSPLPGSVRSLLVRDQAFSAAFDLQPKFALPLGPNYIVETSSLHDAQRKAVAGRKSAMLVLQDGRRVRARLSRRGGTATIILGQEGFNFEDSDLLAAEKPRRLRALRRVLAAKPLSAEEEMQWHSVAKQRAFTDEEYVMLATDLSATPEAFARRFAQPRNIDSDALLPDEPIYFERLLAPLSDAADIEAFIQGPLAATRMDLMRRYRKAALRRIAYAALWQPLIPFELLASVEADEVASLLAANDPFSLLCGFELCCHGLSRDRAFIAIGTQFLEKLCDEKKGRKQRCNLFTALAVIATVNIRTAIKPTNAPLWWARLAALAHAGVLTDATSSVSDTEGFLKWAAELFGPNYLWTTTIDLHDAPRWRPEWIDAEYIFAELVGLILVAINPVPPDERPAKWVSVVEASVAELMASGLGLVAQFPGPFDEFHPSATPKSSAIEAFSDVETKLKTATHLDGVPELFALASASQPSESVVANVRRIVTGPVVEPLSQGEELKYLRIAARIGARARDTAIGNAVINRCLILARRPDRQDRMTDILQVMVEACATYSDAWTYWKQVGDALTAICFAASTRLDLENLLAICDTLSIRDEKLTPALSKARAVARLKISLVSSPAH